MHGPQAFARAPSALSTSTEILISPVKVIIFMLDLIFGEGGKHALGNPGVRAHAGAYDRNLADFFLVAHLGPQLCCQGCRNRASTAARSFFSTVKPMAARPLLPIFWAIMSTTRFCSANTENTR